MNYFSLAVAPGIAIILFILYKDRYNKEPRINLIVSFFLGCLSMYVAREIELSAGRVTQLKLLPDGSVPSLVTFAFIVVAGTEELVKFICLRFYSYRQKSFDEPLDGIVYSLMVGMGFATVENIYYVYNFAAYGEGIRVGLQRAFMAVPAHATFAVMMGYYAGKAKFSKNGFGLLLFGFLAAVFFHGSYDFFLFLKPYSYLGVSMDQTDELLLIGGAALTLIIGVIISFKFIRRQRLLSMETYHRQQELLRQQQEQQPNTPFSA
jgi:protease PrsW